VISLQTTMPKRRGTVLSRSATPTRVAVKYELSDSGVLVSTCAVTDVGVDVMLSLEPGTVAASPLKRSADVAASLTEQRIVFRSWAPTARTKICTDEAILVPAEWVGATLNSVPWKEGPGS
jgi:hypothetical protein